MKHTYRKKSVEVQAIQFTGNNVRQIWDEFGAEGIYFSTDKSPNSLLLITIDGEGVPCPPGHWVVAEPIPDRFYPCDPGVFADRYEKVD